MLGYYTDWIVCQAEEKPQMKFFLAILCKNPLLFTVASDWKSIMKSCEYQFHISRHQAFERSRIHKLEMDGGLISFSFFLFYFGFQFLGILEKGELEFAVLLWKIRKWRHYSRQHWLRRWHMSTQKGASCSLMTLLWSCLLISRLSLPCSHYQTLAFP